MRRIQLVALFAVFSFAMASVAVAGGPKGPRPAKANIHSQKGTVPKGAGKSAKGTSGKAHAGKKSSDAAASTSKAAKADRAERSEKSDKSIAGNIEKNPQLESRIKSMLPAEMTIAQASEGFRNQGQFIAAVNASKNRNIPFADLKTEMTGDSALSLGQAVQKLRPNTDADPD